MRERGLEPSRGTLGAVTGTQYLYSSNYPQFYNFSPSKCIYFFPCCISGITTLKTSVI